MAFLGLTLYQSEKPNTKLEVEVPKLIKRGTSTICFRTKVAKTPVVVLETVKTGTSTAPTDKYNATYQALNSECLD